MCSSCGSENIGTGGQHRHGGASRSSQELDLWEMIQTVGMGRRVNGLNFRCRNCGKHRVEFRMVSETGDHKPVVGDSWPG